ncbi:MAG: O-antigen translocase [Flavobacteriaceae bacterium]|nr:O-antigen translocase [Flavobacteriaceae bacterium]|tara:strand:+ start:11154 stop:12428 length:1275 start_codon:yes stop_codon:yes gene_type:complete
MQLFSFLKKEFVKNVLTLVKGSVASQVILYLSILVLTRIFSTELFGIYMLFSSALLVLKPISTLQYEVSLVLPKKDQDAFHLGVFSFVVLLVYTLLILFGILFLKDTLSDFFGLDKLSFFLYLLPISVLFFGSISIFEFWNNRKKTFGNISNGLILKAGSMSAIQIGSGLSPFNYLGLIPGLIIGQFLHLLFLLGKSIKEIREQLKGFRWNQSLQLAKKYKDIPLFNTVISITNSLSNELPVILISNYFGLGAAGIYGLAAKFMKAPVGAFQQSVYQVFYNRASNVYNQDGDLHSLVLKTTKNLLILSMGLFLPLFLISFALENLFGSNWKDVGLYARILIPWLLTGFLSNPINSLIVVLNRQKTMLVLDVFLLISRFLALYFGYHYFNSIIYSLGFFSGVGFVFNVIFYVYLLSISKVNSKSY